MTSAPDQDQWEKVPECIKQYYTEEEWRWLSDAEKAGLIQNITEPEA
jgi:hypothetical protein